MFDFRFKKWRLGCLVLVLLAGLLVMPNRVHAQFWKRLFGGHKKEHKRVEERPVERVHEDKDVGLSEVKVLPVYPRSVEKERYRVDVLLPLGLDRYVPDGRVFFRRLPVDIKPVVNYYEGIRLAAERLGEEGLLTDFYVHDVGVSGGKIGSLIADGVFGESDLIIGFLHSENLGEVAAEAKRLEVNFISALSPSDGGVVGNPYFIMMQPILARHIEALTAFAKKEYAGYRFVLLCADSTSVQKESMFLLRQSLSEVSPDSFSCARLLRDPEGFAASLDSNQINVLFVNILSADRAGLVLSRLRVLSGRYKIVVFGMPTWKYIKGLSNYSGLEVYFTCPYYFDTKTARGAAVVSGYKKAFNGFPSEMVFRGYETSYWSVHLLHRYGTIFNAHLDNARMAPFTRYGIEASWSSSNDFEYFENRHLYIFHYLNGRFNVLRP